MKKIYLPVILGMAFFLIGFNLDNAIVPKERILSGGPPKDGIPAILKPNFIRPEQADFISGKEQVIGVTIKGTAKAYPIKILNWHEVVNDTVAGIPIVVTF
jgi:hypothetical protein